MAEPAATLTLAACAATGAIATPLLCALGIDPVSIGAGLAGCAIVQIFLPSETVEVRKIALTALGGMLVAVIGTPFAVPEVYVVLPTSVTTAVTPGQVKIAAAALLGGMAKPIVLLINSLLMARLKKADNA